MGSNPARCTTFPTKKVNKYDKLLEDIIKKTKTGEIQWLNKNGVFTGKHYRSEKCEYTLKGSLSVRNRAPSIKIYKVTKPEYPLFELTTKHVTAEDFLKLKLAIEEETPELKALFAPFNKS